MINQSFLLCAGKATRLHPLTLLKPKCLLPVGDKLVLDLILDWLEKYGIDKHVCNTYWQKQLIHEYFANRRCSHKIVDEEEILGTCGGLMNSLTFLENTFVVVYGDTITNLDLGRAISLHMKRDADISIVAGKSATPWAGGVIEADNNDKIISIIEKPDKHLCRSDLVNAGILIFNKTTLERYKMSNFFDISKDLLPACLQDNLNIYQISLLQDEFFIDMGTFENYEKIKRMYS